MPRAQRCLVATGVAVLVGPWYTSGLLAQSLPPADAFDVASIKLATAKTVSRAFTFPGGRLELGQVTVRDLINYAFGLNCMYEDCNHYILGGPPWVYTLQFEIVAKPAPPDPPMNMVARRERARPRVGALLADRFQLRFHTDERDMPLYALRVAKGGPKLTEETDLSGDKAPVGGVTGPFWVTARNCPLKMLIPVLARATGRPVIDRTGLTSTYRFELFWDPGYPVPQKLFGDMDPPSIFQAVEEQLGLTLHPERGLVKTIVIDHVVMPSAN